MNRFALVCLAGVVLGIALPAQAQNSQYSMDYWGYTHQEGGLLGGLGFVDDIQPPLTVDLENFQYTCVFEGLHLDSLVVDEFGYEHYYYTGGTFRVYEDASWNAIYDDTWCPEPYDSTYISEPWTFSDGEMILGGEFDHLLLDYFPQFQFGNYDGTMDLVEGTHLYEIPEILRNGWTFGGVTDQPWACIPDGYEHRMDGQLFLVEDPTATVEATWGGVKSLFK
ncbi:MAG: hypothetical protein KAW17_11805 [Candidatus Eisenbacteria sp.]|nr:hypothetical protein [Candidatus Eisenbacteria bacterium]